MVCAKAATKGFILVMVKILLFFLLLGTQLSAQQKVTIGLDWFPNPHHALLIIAKEKGFFESEGLDVRLIPAGSSSEGCRQVGTKALDFTVTLEPQLYLQQSKGVPLQLATVLIDQPLEVMVSRFPIQELSHKTIGHCSSGAGFSAMAAKQMFAYNKVPEPKNFLYVKTGLLGALLLGNVDAVINIYKTYNLLDLEKYAGTGAFYVYEYIENGVPPFASVILVTHTDTPSDLIKRLNQSLKKALAYLKNQPFDETWGVFANAYPEQNTKLNEKVWKLLIPMFKVVRGENYPNNEKLRGFMSDKKS